MSDVSFHNADNFVRNLVSVRCGRRNLDALSRKVRAIAALPISIDDLMLDLRVDSDEEAPTVRRMANAAAEFIERRTGYVIRPGRYEVLLDGFGDFDIQRGPLRELESIEYLVAADDWEALPAEDYRTIRGASEFKVRMLSTFDRPAIWGEAREAGVRMTFTAGYETAESDADYPLEDGLAGVLTLLTGHYLKNRELFDGGNVKAVELGASNLLGPYRKLW